MATAVTSPAPTEDVSAHPVATSFHPPSVSFHPAAASFHPFLALVTLWHLLSLDAPCVAAVWTIFFARRFGVVLPWTAPAALALAVWMLYALDRLADAAHPQEVLAERHRFHHRHGFAFAGALLGAVPALIALIALLPAALRTGWLLLAVPLAIYVAAVHVFRLRRVPKEHIVSIFFALATAMPVLVSRTAPTLKVAPAIALFGVLCWLNCVAIARWEQSQNTDTVTAWASPHFLLTTAVVVAVVLLLLIVVPFAGAACAISALLLLWLEYARPNALLLRALADAALLTPLAVLPFLR